MVKQSIMLVGVDWPLTCASPGSFNGPGEGWEFVFLRSGLEGLNYLTERPFDAVIADSDLPDMDGGHFLDLVMRRHPQIVRFLHTSLGSDQERLQMVGITHQLLAKPTSPQTLCAALKRAVSFKTWLPGGAVQKLLTSLGKLPSPPEIYFEVIKEIQRDDSSAESVGKLVARDPVMTAKLLQMANSVAFGLYQQISDAGQAVLYLGMETTRSLILLAHSFSYFDRFKLAAFRPEQLWSHSVAVGLRARRIARFQSASEETIEQAYTAGLLHDLGKLVLAVNLPDLFAQVARESSERQVPFWQVEKELFGASHAEVAAALLGVWGLPGEILEAVSLHHSPARLLHADFCALTAVHAANVLVHEAQAEQRQSIEAVMDLNYIDELGLTSNVEKWRELCKNFGVRNH